MADEQIKNKISKLVDTLNYHSYKYYVQDDPEISDYEYDMLMRDLKKLENDYPQYRLKHSPTLRVGDIPLKEFQSITHKIPLKSLQDVFSYSELEDFEDRIKKFTSNPEYAVELKIDGLSVAIEYVDGVLNNAATRGDGFVGEDVTANIKTIQSVPLKLTSPVNIIVRGEVYMPKKCFKKLNEKQQAEGKQLFANPRNAAAGSLRQLDSSIVANRKLDIFIFNVQWCENKTFATHSESLDYLKTLGFKVSPYYSTFNSISHAFSEIERFAKIRDTLDFDIDGAVVKLNDITLRPKLGETAKYPRWAVAYKYPPEQKETKLSDIIINVGRTGVLTPNAVFDPVILAGTTVSRATLHNQNFIKDLDIKIGDSIIVQKAGEIIPEVVGVNKEKRNGCEKVFSMPNQCPVCFTPVITDESGVAVRCPNPACEAKISRQIIHFASKDAMDIDGMGPSVVKQLLDNNLISDVSDLYILKTSDLSKLEGFAELSANNIINAIEKSKSAGLDRLLFGLGIRNIGQKAAKSLAKQFGNIDNIINATFDEINQIEDYGETSSAAVIDYFNNFENISLINKLKSYGVSTEFSQDIKDDRFEGKIFVLSGGLDSLTRSEASAIIESYGGKISSSVSSKTSYLLLGDKPGSKLTKAKALGITILEEADFLRLIK